MPDTVTYADGDTVELYTSGLDSITVLYEASVPDSLMENAWAIEWPDTRMLIRTTHHDYTVNQGVFGVNLTDFFEDDHGNVEDNPNYTAIPDPWEALITLAPKTIRVFSGAGGKFMHPLGSPQDPAVPDGIWNGGYGFRWEELIPFYDKTDDEDDAPLPTIIADQMSDGECDEDLGECDWILGKFRNDFEDFYNKAADQPTFDPDGFGPGAELERPLYINQCINLIHQIEDSNPGHVVDVIYVINIQTQTATEVLEVIDYLRDHDINVTALELGNEVYFDFHGLSMDLSSFENYWDYINGVNFGDLEDILPAEVYLDHNYILKLKGDPDYFDLKIGLPAVNTPNCGADYDFPLTPPPPIDGMSGLVPVITDGGPCPCFYPDWNIAMKEKFGETITTEGIDRYKFNAMIFHTYYGPTNNTGTCMENSNWRDILLTNLHSTFDPDPAALAVMDLAYELYPDQWDYILDPPLSPDPSAPDANLIEAFYGITGIHYPDFDSPLLPGNYKEFTKSRLDIAYEEHAAQMGFTAADTEPISKEVWITEYNLDDKIDLPPVTIPGLTALEIKEIEDENLKILSPLASSATNTFAHATMMLHWFLWNLKSAYDPDYRNNFLTIATTQNFLSAGSTLGLLGRSDLADQVLLGEVPSCADDELSAYFVRKALYYSALLQKPIVHQNLRYLKSNIALSMYNNNLTPTMFLARDGLATTDDTLYMYYTNVSDAAQVYVLEPGTLVNDYGGPGGYAIEVGSGPIDAKVLNTYQLYSTGGLTSLYGFNLGYETCSESIERENRFEIEAVEIINPEITCPAAVLAEFPYAVCVSLPAVSMGYVKIPFRAFPLHKGDLVDNYVLFPNPTDTHFSVYRKSNATTQDAMTGVSICSVYGNTLMHFTAAEGDRIPIASLPSGTYMVIIELENGNMEFEQVVKMQ